MGHKEKYLIKKTDKQNEVPPKYRRSYTINHKITFVMITVYRKVDYYEGKIDC